jgi:hypothetical protein
MAIPEDAIRLQFSFLNMPSTIGKYSIALALSSFSHTGLQKRSILCKYQNLILFENLENSRNIFA